MGSSSAAIVFGRSRIVLVGAVEKRPLRIYHSSSDLPQLLLLPIFIFSHHIAIGLVFALLSPSIAFDSRTARVSFSPSVCLRRSHRPGRPRRKKSLANRCRYIELGFTLINCVRLDRYSSVVVSRIQVACV